MTLVHPRLLPSLYRRAAAAICLATALLLVLAAPPAQADEIVYRDPETCEEVTVRTPQISAETWTEIRYREKARGPEMKIPTAQVVRIVHDLSRPEEKELMSAIGELERGNLTEARRQLKILSGGGYKQDLDSGQLVFQPFTVQDEERGRKRAPWASEYAHFFYAKALFLEGKKKKDEELLQQAHLALVDQKVPGGDGKTTTGGFDVRFAGGNSRWYPEAMLLAAQTLVAMGDHGKAEKAYQKLRDAAAKVDMGPRWAYEAKLGPGVIAEARGDERKAFEAYVDTASFMVLLVKKGRKACIRNQIGRYHSRARMEAARVLLRQAEENKSPAEFAKLRSFIQESTPEALAKKFSTLTEAQRNSLVQGALDPEVQAVLHNGLGLAYLHDERYEDAILAFRSVEVKYFQVPEEHARALHYLAEAAGAAAGEARQEEARKLFQSYADGALQRLREEYPGSRWAK